VSGKKMENSIFFPHFFWNHSLIKPRYYLLGSLDSHDIGTIL
jgi:hypothetical protein